MFEKLNEWLEKKSLVVQLVIVISAILGVATSLAFLLASALSGKD